MSSCPAAWILCGGLFVLSIATFACLALLLPRSAWGSQRTFRPCQ
jgi:hypothetical protein